MKAHLQAISAIILALVGSIAFVWLWILYPEMVSGVIVGIVILCAFVYWCYLHAFPFCVDAYDDLVEYFKEKDAEK